MPLSPLIRFGTSTWTYEGWQAWVYNRQYAKSRFTQDVSVSLANTSKTTSHCSGPWKRFDILQTSHDKPTPAVSESIPEDFEMCCTVWEDITIPRCASHVRYRAKAGQANPGFLDAKLFNEMVLTPYRKVRFEPDAGPFPVQVSAD